MATLVHQSVVGGPHANASFMPTNGVAARVRVEHAIMALRARGVKNARGRYLDEQAARRKRRHSKRA